MKPDEEYFTFIDPSIVGCRKFPNRVIAEIIERWVETGESFIQLAKYVGATDKTIGTYINKYYLGKTKGPTKEIVLQSKTNN